MFSLSGGFVGNTSVSAYPVPDATVLESGAVTRTGMNMPDNSNLPWRLYSDGTLVVEEGYISWTFGSSPFIGACGPRSWHLIQKIVFTGPVIGGEHLNNIFSGFGINSNITIEGLEYFDTSNVRTMSRLFFQKQGLTELDLSNWDVSNVENMDSMFAHSRNLSSLNLSGWDTSNVRDMTAMFRGMDSLTDLDIAHFDTNNVMSMALMFEGTLGLTSLDLSGWDTRNVRYMENMFERTSPKLQPIFGENFVIIDPADLPVILNHYGTATNHGSYLPWRLYSDGTLIVKGGTINMGADDDDWFMLGPWSNWSSSIYRIVFTEPVIAIESLHGLFSSMHRLTEIEGLHYFDTSNVVNMQSVFDNSSRLTNLDLSGWDTSNVTNMNRMFWGTSYLESINLSSFDTRNVTDMTRMFSNRGHSLRKLTLGENFVFVDFVDHWASNADLSAPRNFDYTGRWQNVGIGTTDNPQGEFTFTSNELMENLAGTAIADTWVWQRRTVSEIAVHPTASKILVNGEYVAFQAYHIDGNNFFRLRDIAYILSGTTAQFDVEWDEENDAIILILNQAYKPVGGEMVNTSEGTTIATPTLSEVFTYFRLTEHQTFWERVYFAAYHIDGNNYFMLRDIGNAVGFNVDWDSDTNTILISTHNYIW